MKKTLLLIFSVIIGLTFAACEDPYANQLVAEPGGYAQGTQQDANFVATVKSGVSPLIIQKAQLASDSVALVSCTSIPALVDSTATIVYKLQLSHVSTFASYNDISSVFVKSGAEIKVSYGDLNTQLLSYNNAVAEQTVYARVLAFVTKTSGLKTLLTTQILNFKATPYKKPLSTYAEVAVKPYYIVGMADGAWNNSVAGLGVSIYPMSVVAGEKYNDQGAGEFKFTGYFKASKGFKLIRDLGNWDEQWGQKSGAYVHNDNASSDIKVASDGYYTLTLNSINNTLTIEAASITPASYTSMGLIGGFNSWGSDVAMTAAETSNNHIWYTTYNFSTATEGKFRANGNWDVAWGGSTFPAGIATSSNGPNTPIAAGNYVVIFNDLDGCYYYIAK